MHSRPDVPERVPRNDRQHGRLARSVRAEHGEHRPDRHGDVDVVEHLDAAVAGHDVVELDRRRHR
jgi:hypothetical protein